MREKFYHTDHRSKLINERGRTAFIVAMEGEGMLTPQSGSLYNRRYLNPMFV
jgi:hypothetical protein